MTLRILLYTAFILSLAIPALQRGFRPRGNNSRKWYDRAIIATGGIILVLFWGFLLVAYFFGPQR